MHPDNEEFMKKPEPLFITVPSGTPSVLWSQPVSPDNRIPEQNPVDPALVTSPAQEGLQRSRSYHPVFPALINIGVFFRIQADTGRTGNPPSSPPNRQDPGKLPESNHILLVSGWSEPKPASPQDESQEVFHENQGINQKKG